ncbi:MAG: 4-phosphopantetheinyl transferase [Gaiellaceae bacterium]|nr:4-phosphopantetheinyl transferase [Gaiellaceae bacterium]
MRESLVGSSLIDSAKRLPQWPPVRPWGELVIETGEVHVWRAALDVQASSFPRLWDTLDTVERARAARFVFERHRLRYVVAHGLLRHVLSGYLATTPEKLRFGRGRYGKPYLTATSGAALRFNLSHSRDRMLVAVGLGRELGVDLEYVRCDRDVAGIARHFFSTAEVSALLALPVRERCAAFYRCWTRKEAYIKACGTGLAMRLDSFDVSLEPGARAALLRSERGHEEPQRWKLVELPVEEGFHATLAVEGDDWRVVANTLDSPG